MIKKFKTFEQDIDPYNEENWKDETNDDDDFIFQEDENNDLIDFCDWCKSKHKEYELHNIEINGEINKLCHDCYFDLEDTGMDFEKL